MAEYSSGLSFARICTYDKERIKHALKGELMCGETKDGFEYTPAPKKECEKYILSAYDEVVLQALTAMRSGRALDRIINNNGIKVNLMDYMRIVAEEEQKETDRYQFEDCDEDDEDDLAD